METTIVYWGYFGIMEKKMEITIMGYIGILGVYIGGILGIMEKNMEITIMGYIGIILGLYRGYIGDNGKENGNYYGLINYNPI